LIDSVYHNFYILTNIMAISFGNDDRPVVETVEETDSLVSDDEDETTTVGSEVSMSKYDLVSTALPPYCFFGSDECLALFTQSSDKGKFERVCGGSMPCTRHGHATAEKAKHGYYAPVKARKYCDGRFDTFLSQEEFEKFDLQRKEARQLEFLAVTPDPKGSIESPTVSEEGMYQLFSEIFVGDDRKPAAIDRKPVPQRVITPGPRSFFGADDSPKKVSKPAGKVKKEGGGLVGSPSAKILQEAGVLTEEIPQSTLALMGMMDKMTEVLSKLADKETPPLASKARRSVSPGDVRLKPAPRSYNKEAEVGSTKEKWYAVGYGRGGRSGVFQSWGEAAPLVNGVGGAVYKRFNEFEAAMDFVHRYEATNAKLKDTPAEDVPHSDFWYSVINPSQEVFGVYPSWSEAMPHVTGVKGATCKKYRSFEDATDHMNAAKVEVGETRGRSLGEPAIGKQERAVSVEDSRGFYPPDVLMGPDPSKGNEDVFFGVDANLGESELRSALCPGDMSESVAKGLMNATIDVVSMPGGFFGGDSSQASSELGILGEAVEELVNQRQGSSESSGRMDLHWRNKDRTSIRSIKSAETLRKRIIKLQKLQQKAIKRMVQATTNAMKRDGVVSAARISAWATRGFVTRLVTDTLNLYLGLHQHLMGLANERRPWSYIRVEVDHHVEELDLIRQTSECRLQCLGSVYIYLRDMSDKTWHCNALQSKRNMEMYERTEGGGYEGNDSDDESDGDDDTESWLGCVHCGTCLHVGGKDDCPWNQQDKAEAKKSGAAAIRKMAKPKKKSRGGKGKKGKE
jgi:hypothetical protein